MNAHDIRSLIYKIIAIRRRIMKTGRSYKNVQKCVRICNDLEAWFDHWPQASLAQIVHCVKVHKEDINFIVGSKNEKAKTALEEIYSLDLTPSKK